MAIGQKELCHETQCIFVTHVLHYSTAQSRAAVSVHLTLSARGQSLCVRK